MSGLSSSEFFCPRFLEQDLREHPDDVILRTYPSVKSESLSMFSAADVLCNLKTFVHRTKQWMASPTYDKTILVYPRQIALEKLQIGLPQGWLRVAGLNVVLDPNALISY